MTTPTPTPQDLLAAITRAVTDGATPDDRRAGRRAAMLLASTLGEPGEPMHLGAPTRPTIDRAQLLDLAIAKMRAFVDEQEAKAAPPPAEAKPAPASSSPSSTAAPRPRPPLTTPPLRIPLIGAPRRP